LAGRAQDLATLRAWAGKVAEIIDARTKAGAARLAVDLEELKLNGSLERQDEMEAV